MTMYIEGEGQEELDAEELNGIYEYFNEAKGGQGKSLGGFVKAFRGPFGIGKKRKTKYELHKLVDRLGLVQSIDDSRGFVDFILGKEIPYDIVRSFGFPPSPDYKTFRLEKRNFEEYELVFGKCTNPAEVEANERVLVAEKRFRAARKARNKNNGSEDFGFALYEILRSFFS